MSERRRDESYGGCRLGAQAALCLLASASSIALWTCHGARSTLDIETPLLRVEPSARPKASVGGLLWAAFAVLAGGAVAALCGLGGGHPISPQFPELLDDCRHERSNYLQLGGLN